MSIEETIIARLEEFNERLKRIEARLPAPIVYGPIPTPKLDTAAMADAITKTLSDVYITLPLAPDEE